jgi:hypothetical protein
MDANLLSSHSNSLLRDANDNESSRAHLLISRDQGFISLLVLCNTSPNSTKRLELLNDSPAVQEVYLSRPDSNVCTDRVFAHPLAGLLVV